MRSALCALLVLSAASAASAQEAPDPYGRGTTYEGLLVDHEGSNAPNGSVREDQRLGGAGHVAATPVPTHGLPLIDPRTGAQDNHFVHRLAPGDTGQKGDITLPTGEPH